MKISRVWGMPNAETFQCKPIREFVLSRLNGGVSIDPFARNFGLATYTNDMDPNTSAQHHLEAAEYLEWRLLCKEDMVDVIIFDPPYSLEQCSRFYKNVGRTVTQRDTQIFMRWTQHKDLCAKLLKPDGIFLHFGWHSNGMGKKRGFEIVELLLVSHGSGHHDTICIAEQRARPSDEA